MPFKLNPFTGTLDYFEISSGSGGSGATIAETIAAILLDQNPMALPGQPEVSILFDESSILFNDDEAI